MAAIKSSNGIERLPAGKKVIGRFCPSMIIGPNSMVHYIRSLERAHVRSVSARVSMLYRARCIIAARFPFRRGLLSSRNE